MIETRQSKAFYCPSCRCAVGEHDQCCASCDTGRPPLGWPEDIYIGRIIGKKYRLDRRISSGGFGIIFLATHLHQTIEIGKVIVKMLHPEHNFEPVIKKRFINEAKAARTIQNPHVVKIFDLDFDKGMVPYMVQEYVEGETLSGLLAVVKKLGVPRAVSIAIQVAEGMMEAHQKGILHRDLKPDNIILQNVGGSDFVKLIDFGIARLEKQSTLATASFIGTPRYMSPEQIRGGELDRRSDIFSLGVIIFEMVTGEAPIPIEGEGSEIEYLNLNVLKQPRKIIDLDPTAPEPLSLLVDSMLRKNPRERPADFEAVIAELARLAESLGWRADHTGSYRTTSVPPEGTTETDARTSIHEKSTWTPGRERPASVPASPLGRKKALAALAVGAAGAAVLVALLWIFALFPRGGQGGPESAGASQGKTALRGIAAAAPDASVSDAAEPADLPAAAEAAPASEAEIKPEPSGGETGKKKPGKKKKKEVWTKI
jgi:serine/threonine protein kinase